MDSGRSSGHGRVVLSYFELCEKVWGGSLTTEQLYNNLGWKVEIWIMWLKNVMKVEIRSHMMTMTMLRTTAVNPPPQRYYHQQQLQWEDGFWTKNWVSTDKTNWKGSCQFKSMLDCARGYKQLVEQMDNMEKHYAESIASILSAYLQHTSHAQQICSSWET